MLKIKDNVDLKELEKYGIYKKQSIFTFNYDYTDENLVIYKKDRTIDCWEYLECTDLERYNDKLYDLIKADLVEKVKEEEE